MADHETLIGAVSSTRPVPKATVGAATTGPVTSPPTVIVSVAVSVSVPSLMVYVITA